MELRLGRPAPDREDGDNTAWNEAFEHLDCHGVSFFEKTILIPIVR
jgi:hypothetical protein